MESISIMDGLVLTVVSMLVVFSVLTALWGLTELTAKLVNRNEQPADSPAAPVTAATGGLAHPTASPVNTALTPNPKHQLVAELMALTLASHDQPDAKLEIHETLRIK